MRSTRRDFLKKGGCALGMAAVATQMQHLGALNAMAQKAIDTSSLGDTGYKAIVCLLWSGGNDGNNMIIPIHNDANISNYSTYSTIRTPRASNGLAIPDTELLGVSATNVLPGLNTYGFHPNLGTGPTNAGIKPLYDAGKLAVVCNVGTLARPMSRTQYFNGTVMKPYQLGSHSDQVDQHQSGVASTATFTGWGGRLADKLNGPYNNPPGDPTPGLIPMVTSIAGAQVFTTGQVTLPLAIGQANNTGANNLLNILAPGGLPNTTSDTTINARKTAWTALRSQDLSSNFVKATSEFMNTAMSANTALQTAQDTTVVFPNNSVSLQLKQVARLIKSRNSLNIQRQVFYVQIGGFDNHTDQIVDQANLFMQFSQAMRAFWDEMVAQGVENSVTLFTISDFNRTMNPAGVGLPEVGSDHAWGNHMFVMGGAVNGGNFYGSKRPDGTGDLYPTLQLNGPDDSDSGTGARGRWLPTTSVEQYAVQIARWFGLQPGDEAAVFPNLQYFTAPTPFLNFMQAP